MTDTDRMVAWLREAMGAAQADAEAAAEGTAPDWTTDSEDVVTKGGQYVAVGAYGGPLDDGVRSHIIRNDPAAVLRRIAADRNLLDDLLAETHEVVEDPWYTCAAATEEHDGGRCCDDIRRGKPCDCGRDKRVGRRVRLLAEGYGWKGGDQ